MEEKMAHVSTQFMYIIIRVPGPGIGYIGPTNSEKGGFVAAGWASRGL
jgi:hypothetical protein